MIDSKLGKWIIALIMVIAITQASCGIFSGVYYALGSLTGTRSTISLVTTLWLGGSVLCDLLISGTIVTFVSEVYSFLHASKDSLLAFGTNFWFHAF